MILFPENKFWPIDFIKNFIALF